MSHHDHWPEKYPMPGQLPLSLSPEGREALLAAKRLHDQPMDDKEMRRHGSLNPISFTASRWMHEMGPGWGGKWSSGGFTGISPLYIVWKNELHRLGFVIEDGWFLYQLSERGLAYIRDCL